MLDTFFWMTGAALWAVVGLLAAAAGVHIVHGLVCAFSLTLFCARALRKGGEKITWRMVTTGTWHRWYEMIGHHNNGSNKYTLKTGAVWRGPFDYDKV